MTQLGLDCEGRITNWSRVKDLGYKFVVARAVGENGAIDPDFQANVQGARDSGLIPGAYIFLAHGTAADYTKRFIDTVGPLSHDEPFLIQIDVEKPNYHPIPTIDDVAASVETWKAAHPDWPFQIYSADWYWGTATSKGYLGNPNGSRFTPYLWHSGGPWYRASSPAYPGDRASEWAMSYGGWQQPTMWQYHGSINLGIGPSVDINAFRGTFDQLLALAGLEDKIKLPYAPSRQIGTASVKKDATHYAFDADRVYTKLTAGQVLPIFGEGTLLVPVNDANKTNLAVLVTKLGGRSQFVLRDNVENYVVSDGDVKHTVTLSVDGAVRETLSL